MNSGNDGLKLLFYLLLCDKLPASDVEKLVRHVKASSERGPWTYSNQFIADYAAELASRIRSVL
jgi:hypothetical protein